MAQYRYLLVYAITGLLLAVSCNAVQFCSRLTLSDLGGVGAPTTDGLISQSLSSGPGISVEVFHMNILCETIGFRRGRYRYTSVVANYTRDSNPVTTSQFEYECNVIGNTWTANVFSSTNGTVTTPPDAGFDSPLESNCGVCVSPSRAATLFVSVNVMIDDNHCGPCVGCIGLNQCTSLLVEACCNYYTNDVCVSSCPSDSTLNTTINECICTPGVTGSRCNIDIDECTADPNLCTVNGSICLNSFGSYMCECGPGFRGRLCEDDIDECVDGTDNCTNGATCSNTHGSYQCKCPPAFKGISCETDVNECLIQDPCKNGAICVNTNGSFNCTCPPGYTGMLCENDIDECTMNPCFNSGVCENSQGTFTCNCRPEFTGNVCDMQIDLCFPISPCGIGGRCDTIENRFVCTCDPGFSGQTCNNVDECSQGSNPCNNNGTCIDSEGSFSCMCTPTFTGPACENDINECDTFPGICQNGGTCENMVGSFMCFCPPGYSGMNCDEDIDECLTLGQVCQNNGTCTNSDGNFNCTCRPGFSGLVCEDDIDECSQGNGLCLNGGNCTNTFGSFTCDCQSGYTGTTCGNDTDECANTPCLNGGTCVNSVGSYSCSCSQFWTGQTCDVDNDECLQDPCQNGGTCSNAPGNYSCQCGGFWTGTTCDVDIDECLQDPCQNGGTCSNTPGNYSCQCGGFWTGTTCVECLINFCSVCSGVPAQCQQCDDGYDITESGICTFTEVCSPECRQGECINGQCECATGFFGGDCSGSCSTRIPGCADCSVANTDQEIACNQCEVGYIKDGNECKAPCNKQFCNECTNNGDECLTCSTNYRLNRATKQCLRSDDNVNGLTNLHIIGLIVGMIIFAITLVAITACIIFGVYRKKEVPKMKKSPKKNAFQKHGQKDNRLYMESKHTIELEKAETGLTDGQMVTLEYMTPGHDLYDGPAEDDNGPLASITEGSLEYEAETEDNIEDSF